MCPERRFSTSFRQQPGQSGEVVGCHRQDEPRPDAFYAAIHGLRHVTDGFRPAERLLYPFAVPSRQGIAIMPGGSGGDC